MRLRSSLVLLVLLLASCGGGDEPPAEAPLAATDSVEPSGETTAPIEAAADLVVSGEPVAFEPASGPDVAIPLGDDGSCELPLTSFDHQPPEIALCAGHFSGAGGDFVVATIGREIDSYDVGIFCSSGGDDYHLTAAAFGAGTPVIQQFDFAKLGEVAGVVLFEGRLSESKTAPAALVSQPEGAACPQFHGVGDVGADLVTQGGLNGASVLGYLGADGKLATCSTVVDGGFVTKPASGDSCPEPNGG